MNIILTILISHFFIAVLITYIHWLNKNLKLYKNIINNGVPLKGKIIRYNKHEFKSRFLGRRINGERNDPVIQISIDNENKLHTSYGRNLEYYKTNDEIDCYKQDENGQDIETNVWEEICLGIINMFFNILLNSSIWDYSIALMEYITEYNEKLIKFFKKVASILLAIVIIITYIVLFNQYCSDLRIRIAREEKYDKSKMSDSFSIIATLDKDYDYIWEFSEGRAVVVLDGLRGYIDENGKEIIPVQYTKAGNFVNGIAEVFDNEKFENPKYIDIYGNYVEKPAKEKNYNEVNEKAEMPRFRYSKTNPSYCALFDINGKQITDYKYFMPRTV